MAKEIITADSKKFNNYLHHIDLKEFGTPKVLSSFIAEFDECSLFLDCGTSIEVKRVLRYARQNDISLSKVKYLITTHHHFDHCGGMWKLYDKIKDFNPKVKILTNEMTKILLNDYESHLNRAKRTFGRFSGKMNPIDDEAFKIINPIIDYNSNLETISVIDKFTVNGTEIKLAILSTPGHTHDHQSPIFIKNGEIDFIFFGEAAGTLYPTGELITMPTSMPVYFQYKEYMQTLEKLINLQPLSAGYGHFGAVRGKDNIATLLLDNKSLMIEFRADIIKYYKEKPETRYVVDKISQKLVDRAHVHGENHPINANVMLAITYGMMMDLGYRKE
jgi:glyoxylase-like metal-dependent hydrolase (beta-lactamase superfamily II)